MGGCPIFHSGQLPSQDSKLIIIVFPPVSKNTSSKDMSTTVPARSSVKEKIGQPTKGIHGSPQREYTAAHKGNTRTKWEGAKRDYEHLTNLTIFLHLFYPNGLLIAPLGSYNQN